MYKDKLKNIEVKMLKKIYKHEISSFKDNEFEICQTLRSNGFLSEINVNGHISYTLTDRGIIYLEEKRRELKNRIVYNILVPFFFFMLGVVSSHFEKVCNFIYDIFCKN